MIVYKRVLEKLKDAGYSSYIIKRDRLLPMATMQSIHDGRAITLTTLDKICKMTGLQPGDLIEYVPDPEDTEEGEE